MRIDKLIADNFKNFEHLEVSFVKGINLIVGVNGSGKTSVLEAINVALGGFFSLQEQKMQRVIDLSEARIVLKNGEPIRCPKTAITAYSEYISTPWTRNFNSQTKKNDARFVRSAGRYGDDILKGFFTPNNNIAPLLAYYSSMRLFRDAYQSSKQKYDPLAGRRNGYLQCLNDNAIKGTLIDWLGSSVTTRATKQIKGVELVDIVLENVDKAITRTLVYFLDDLKAEEIKIYQETKFDFDVFMQLKPDFALPVSYYSDGFRNIIYLVIDLIWRASQLNPWLTLEQLAEQQFGCVTIDEIDLHLHPRWQAKSIGLLQELLPNVQFFITTHSPTVVGNFKIRKSDDYHPVDSIYVLQNDALLNVESSYYGKDFNSILENLMDGFSKAKEVADLFKKFYAIAENPNSTSEELNSLPEIAGDLRILLDGSDKGMIKVNSVIERLKMSEQ
jgi:predicted ATP-binding protein involved in virulence